jgi:hypothetical protein
MSDTPETDYAYKNHPWDMHDNIPLEFARQLERERDRLAEALRIVMADYRLDGRVSAEADLLACEALAAVKGENNE